MPQDCVAHGGHDRAGGRRDTPVERAGAPPASHTRNGCAECAASPVSQRPSLLRVCLGVGVYFSTLNAFVGFDVSRRCAERARRPAARAATHPGHCAPRRAAPLLGSPAVQHERKGRTLSSAHVRGRGGGTLPGRAAGVPAQRSQDAAGVGSHSAGRRRGCGPAFHRAPRKGARCGIAALQHCGAVPACWRCTLMPQRRRAVQWSVAHPAA